MDDNELKFEEAIMELDNIIEKLETGDLNIDGAIEEFKRGIKLYKECYKKIEKTEGKIKLILEDNNGDIEESDFGITE